MAEYFFGKYLHQLDDKNRLRIPAKFRKILIGPDGDRSYYFARGMEEGSVYVLTQEELDRILEKIGDEKMGEATSATLLFTESIFEAEEDPQGRVVLPAPLRELSGIEKDLVTVGRVKRIEIWEPDAYRKHIEKQNYKAGFKSLGV